MKILIISAEVWQDGTNGGNVLSNIFSDLDAEFAQIYCNPGMPQNSICNTYYQMTDSMVIKNFLRHKPIGKSFIISDPNNFKSSDNAEQPNKRFYSFFRRYRLGIFYLAKNIAWNMSNWKNVNLEQFITEFNPDIIFAPCYASTFMLRLTRYVAEFTGKSVISYESDDDYSLRQFRLSPFYWFERFFVRNQIRKTFPYYSLVYTMTEMQKEQYEKYFEANMKILMKSASFDCILPKIVVNSPIRIVYAGGIYLNRWKTLAAIADAIREINKNGVKIVLDIYTANEITSKIAGKLDDNVNSFVHGSVSQEELSRVYHQSDIALHVESFDLKHRLAVRMSFSTKIVDCLSSGCAVMAVCDAKQGGFDYLKKQDAAICVSNIDDLHNVLQSIVNHPDIIIDYAVKARNCCERNHNKKKISEMIANDFKQIVNNGE